MNTPWQAISATSAAIAAVAAAAAVWWAVVLRREDRNLLLVRWREQYYKALISRPIVRAYEEFRRKAFAPLGRSVAELGAYCRTDPKQSDVDGFVADLVEQFNGWFYDLKDEIAVGTEAWKDDRLKEELTRAAEMLQDDFTADLQILPRNIDRLDLRSLFNKHAATLRSIVMEHDPGLKWGKQHAGVHNWKSVIGTVLQWFGVVALAILLLWLLMPLFLTAR